MNPKNILSVAFVALLLVQIVSAASDCPAARSDFSPYNKVILSSFKDGKWMTTGYKFVNEPFKVTVTRVDSGSEEPLSGRSVKIYYQGTDGTQNVLEASGKTDSKGEYEFTPTKVGKYKIEAGGRAPVLTVYELLDDPSDFGAVCGNGICEDTQLETPDNCPEDCTICGDAVCEGLEDKDSCPDDCVICGDGYCDPEEYSPTDCSCVVDCIVCGDGICDTAHEEECPEDCGDDESLSAAIPYEEYWWVGVIVVVLIVLFFSKDRILDYLDSRKGQRGESSETPKRKKKKDVFGDDENLQEIIQELMDTGVSDRRIKVKLKEFGLDEKESDKLIAKARK